MNNSQAFIQTKVTVTAPNGYKTSVFQLANKMIIHFRTEE